MNKVTVRGHSDDIIEIEGPGHLNDEFNPNLDAPVYLAFSDGTVLRAEYASGETWVFTVAHQGTADVSIQKNQGGDSLNYSDVVTLMGDIRWCVAGDFLSVED